MPRSGSGVYSKPAGTTAVPNTTITSSQFNSSIDDIAADLNFPRPVSSGGTGAANIEDARNNLGVKIGEDVQAYDALLQAISALTTSADKLIYTTGTDTVALSTITSFARTLIDDADAAAMRTTLGLSAVAATGTVDNSNWSGTALAVANGGTGAGNAATARANLGAAAASTTFSTSGSGLGGGGSLGADRTITLNLATLPGVTSLTTPRVLVVDGTTDGSQARMSPDSFRTVFGFGALSTSNSINNTNWSGDDLSIPNGGTGASDAAGARSNLGLAGLATMDVTDLFYTGSSAGATSYPVSSMIVMIGDGDVSRNQARSPCLHSSDDSYFVPSTNGSAGSALSGTWRARGGISASSYAMQRTL